MALSEPTYAKVQLDNLAELGVFAHALLEVAVRFHARLLVLDLAVDVGILGDEIGDGLASCRPGGCTLGCLHMRKDLEHVLNGRVSEDHEPDAHHERRELEEKRREVRRTLLLGPLRVVVALLVSRGVHWSMRFGSL